MTAATKPKPDHTLRFIRTRGWRLSFRPTGEVSYHYNPLVAKAALESRRLEHKRALALKADTDSVG